MVEKLECTSYQCADSNTKANCGYMWQMTSYGMSLYQSKMFVNSDSFIYKGLRVEGEVCHGSF